MKRALFGILWFIVFFIVLYIIYSVVLGVIVARATGAHGPMNYQEGLQAGMAFAQAHAHALTMWRLAILIVAIVLAATGSVKGVLPGTRKKLPAAAPE